MGEKSRKNEMKKLLSRQAQRLKPARDWLISTKLGSFSSVMEVGCGCGDVLHEFSENRYCVGLDIDLEYLRELEEYGVLGDGHVLPFRNESFDLVYCHMSVMWFKDPVKVIKEMARVSKNLVCCMAEYDYGARLDFPDEFQIIRDRLAEGITADGGDPYVGRKLNKYFKEAGMVAEIGAYCHVLEQEQMREGFESEWEFIEQFTDMDERERGELKRNEYESITKGTRFLFTPVFYAISRK